MMREPPRRWRLEAGVWLALLLLACGQAASRGVSGQGPSGGPETPGDAGSATSGAQGGLEGSGAQAGASPGTGGMGATKSTGGTTGENGGNWGGSTPGGSDGTGAAASGGMGGGQVCEPGALACDGDTATVCREDGMSYAEGGVDCVMSSLEDHSAAGELCASGECVPYWRYNFQGDLPGVDATAESRTLATFFGVSTEARLLRVGHPLHIRAPTRVRFDVFESSSEQGPYQRLVSSEATFEIPETLFYSDGMDVRLQGGYFYAFVISWESPMPVTYKIMKPGNNPSSSVVASATLSSPPGDSLALPEPADEIYYTHYFIEGQ